MTSTLIASSDFLLIEAGQSRTVTITYKNDFSGLGAYLWERTAGERWQRVREARITPIGESVDVGGRFASPALAPGQAYQVLIYHDDAPFADPNRTPTDPSPDAAVTVLAALKGPGPSSLIRNEESGRGGTYYTFVVHTADETFAQLSVSDLAPIENPDGVLEFAAPPTIGTSEDPEYQKDRALTVASDRFLQGQDYHALVRVIDRTGRWQVVHRPFTTRLRKVVAQFTQIHVVNDGDFGENTANFKGWIMAGATAVGSFFLPDRRIWDQPTPGHESEEWIDLNQGPLAQPAVTIGPTATTEDSRALLLLTRGIAKVTVGFDTASGNFQPGPGIVPGSPFEGAEYRFPIGLDEAVEEDDFFVDAIPLTGGEFQYSLGMSVTVSYV